MADHQWFLGQEVTTDPFVKPTKIVKFTPSGQFITADGHRHTAKGLRIGYRILVRPVSPEDAGIREREHKARALSIRINAMNKSMDDMHRSLGRGTFKRFTPSQDIVDRAEMFFAKIGDWKWED